MKKALFLFLFALIFIACGDDSSTSVNNSNDGGNLTDSRDGQTYKTVKIGTQTWMAENLNYETANSYCYGDDAANCSKYGRLYTWAAAVTACPSGWHLPSKAEWETLFNAVGGESTVGEVLKSTSGWNGSGNGTDAFRFSALPAGNRYYGGDFDYEGYYAYFWSSTELDSVAAYYMGLDYFRRAGLYDYDKGDGFSVRCLKGDVTGQTAKSSSSQKTVSSSSDKVTEPVEVTISSMTDARDGQIYKTVKIGTQTWMAENLNYETSNSYCINNSSAKCSWYGTLYTWAAAMDSAGAWSTNGKGCGYGNTCSVASTGSATLVRGVCPEGWHLPSQTEWNTLFNAVGGQSTAGKVLKSTSGWYSGNGSDAFGFSALPAGGSDDKGFFIYEGFSAYFWSSTERSSDYAYFMYLNNIYDEAYLNYSNLKIDGYSVRCVKD